jgi:glycosyltransferase involved in cell wall biosynthesis
MVLRGVTPISGARDPFQLSVIICSHNPRSDYLRRVLEGLSAQTLHRDGWELILVDNASQQRLADSCDLSWHPNHVHVRVDELGLTPARLGGIGQAHGDLLVFVDDDNLLAPDYLERALVLARAYPHLAAFGAGALEPEFEIVPAPDIAQRLAYLAIRKVSTASWSNNPKDYYSVPWGAGLCATRAVATAYAQCVERLGVTQILDRRSPRLFCGGDDLFSFVSVRTGYGFGVFPDLRITHLISADRVAESYLLRLIHDHAYSHGVLKNVLFGEKPCRLELVDAVRVLLHGFRHGRFSMKCRWAAARGAEDARRFLSTQGGRLVEDGVGEVKAPRESSPAYNWDRQASRSYAAGASPKW